MEWGAYLMGFAEWASAKSKDTTQVGAALVGPEKEIRLTAFNGPPRGVRDLPERRQRENGEKYKWSSHAETNLIAFAAREGIRTKGCTVFVTHYPCPACCRTLIQAGVERVVYGAGVAIMHTQDDLLAVETMFREAGVVVFPFMRGKNGE